MQFLFILVVVVVIAYAILLVYYLHHWKQLPEISSPVDGQEPVVSVVVAARNEEDVIGACIRSLLAQDYPGDFEIILVDDHSTDNTVANARSAGENAIKLLTPSESEVPYQGKKEAMAAGIRMARGEVILMTDADCIVPKTWVSELSGAIRNDQFLATGPVVYRKYIGTLEAFQALDLLSLMVITGGGWRSGLHYIGNGANLAVRKDVYDAVGGFDGMPDFPVTEDVVLILKVRMYGDDACGYVKSLNCLVESYPETSIKAFVQQRLRWASQNSRLPSLSVLAVWGYVWLVNVFLLVTIILTCVYPESVNIIILSFSLVLKFIIEFIVLKNASRFAQMAGVMKWFPIAFFINILYVAIIGSLALAGSSFEWKGRRIK